MKNFDDFFKEEEKNDQIIAKLFSKEIIIQENLNAINFSFIKDIDGEFRFYKKGVNFPLNFYERTFSGIYEKAIEFVLHIPEDVRIKIPTLYRFQFDYFPSTKPINIMYKKLPKNNLVLTGVFEYDKYGNIKHIFNNYEDLDFYADILGVERPAICYRGTFNRDVKSAIINLTSDPESTKKISDELLKILKIKESDFEDRFVNQSVDGMTDGYKMSFFQDDEVYHLKIIDDVFRKSSEKRKTKQNISILPILYSEIISFVSTNIDLIEDYKTSITDPEEVYIDIISELFLKYYEVSKKKIQDITPDVIPEFFVSKEYAVNTDNIKNNDLKAILRESSINKAMFKIFLNLFKKKRGDKDNFINPNLIYFQNEIYAEINKKTKVNELVVESLTFLQFLEKTKANDSDFGVKSYQKTEEDIFIDNLIENELYDKEQDFWVHLRPEIRNYKNSKNRTNIIIGSFIIFTKDFTEFIEEEIKNNNLKLYNIIPDLVSDVTKNNLYGTIHSTFCNQEIIKKSRLVSNFKIRDVLSLIKKDEILSILWVDEKDFEFYTKMFDFYKLQYPESIAHDLKINKIRNNVNMTEEQLKEFVAQIDNNVLYQYLDDSIKHLQFNIVNFLNR